MHLGQLSLFKSINWKIGAVIIQPNKVMLKKKLLLLWSELKKYNENNKIITM